MWPDDVVPDPNWWPADEAPLGAHGVLGLLAARPKVWAGTPKCVVAVEELVRGGGKRLVFWEEALLGGKLLPLADGVKSSSVCVREARESCAAVVEWGGGYSGLRVVVLGTYGRRVVVGGL